MVEGSVKTGDLVLVVDDALCRGEWKMGRISQLIISHDGLVRRVKVQVGDRSPNLQPSPVSVLERPVSKLVLLQS